MTCRKGACDRELVRKRVLRDNTKIKSAREKYYTRFRKRQVQENMLYVCYHKIGLFNKSKTCSFITFANHRQPWRRHPCGETLLKEVTLKDNTKRLYPPKIYCYQSLIESIKRLVKKPNFVDRCELWRSREVRSVGQILGDTFDGRVWREFQTYKGAPF